ncbi:MAG: DUF1800 domain-containing protein [Betaproteobacteria bacterium]|nr:DUF1800 domain-containing protein [Betaproteobacteria bacterium]
MALAACGGGGSGGTTSTPLPLAFSPAVSETITRERAARFLIQAAFAATDAQIARVQTLGYSAWLDEQFAMPRSLSNWDWMDSKGYHVVANVDNFNGLENTLWRKLISSPDALRQRMTLALSEIFVVSLLGLPVSWRGFLAAGYVDLLEAQAFGNYRQLLQDVTLSPAMGVYLNMRGNQKANAATGRLPDENYAREVMQLFSIGLVELETDGTLKGGRAQETYNAQTIAQLARVFTGWDLDGLNRTEAGYTRRPMVNLPVRYDTDAKTVLGTSIAAGVPAAQALQMTLDTLAHHPNVAPFISRQLIQRLVSSAPSPAYVGRVAAVFNDNGQGQRGDFKAVIKAILLDEEARRDPSPTDTTRGRLQEPMVRFIQWARTFSLGSPTDLWNIGSLSDPVTRLGQSPMRSPTVFNFFRPGYVPPNTELGKRGITAPEFDITDESTTVGWVNFAQTFVVSGVGETRPNYAAELALAADAAALVQRVAKLLAPDSLSVASQNLITQAVGALPAVTEANRLNRVYAAVLLVLAAPEYLVQA